MTRHVDQYLNHDFVHMVIVQVLRGEKIQILLEMSHEIYRLRNFPTNGYGDFQLESPSNKGDKGRLKS